MDDLELERLVRSADRPRTMAADERARVLALLDASASTGADLALDPTRPDARPRPAGRGERAGRGWHGSSWWLGAAAAAIIVALVAVALARREPEAPAEPAVPVTETLPAAASAWCVERVVPVVDALDQWRGVENWAWADGTPDVGLLVADALATADPERAPGAAAVAVRLRDDLADIADRAPSDIDRVLAERRVAAVDPALDELLAVIAAVDPACPVDAIEVAR